MPAFNAACYIDRAIDSVRGQTISDLELLVVDDGSADDTSNVVERSAALDSRIRLFHQINNGPGPARNVALRAARGRFLAFLDSDDAWAPTFLERQLSLLERRPDVDVIFGNAWNRGGPLDGRPARSTAPDERRFRLADILADDSLHFIMAVFRREVIEAVGGFNPAFLTGEEYEMWLRAGLAGFTFARNPEPLGWYTCRPDSLSSSDTRMLEGAVRVLDHTRPLLPDGSPERAILDRSRARYDADLAAARARDPATASQAETPRRRAFTSPLFTSGAVAGSWGSRPGFHGRRWRSIASVEECGASHDLAISRPPCGRHLRHGSGAGGAASDPLPPPERDGCVGARSGRARARARSPD
jgi:GT2 family glycosyltransferase